MTKVAIGSVRVGFFLQSEIRVIKMLKSYGKSLGTLSLYMFLISLLLSGSFCVDNERNFKHYEGNRVIFIRLYAITKFKRWIYLRVIAKMIVR